ncbi:uncharacterized protein CLUP02_06334 [Colletotrichum lupini]|uniref:Uncharacterized protein n=1 Tax=Colletotrichum lupini TaxID=145971 RepID=A0A9Q8SNW4_9PEZI|nr:uncharacterized protein CLUP02_06334 [Colletotrichum lupini]UQC80849.1 hypothetical protein CLUP02_06334 [Colletotrichum lupini]
MPQGLRHQNRYLYLYCTDHASKANALEVGRVGLKIPGAEDGLGDARYGLSLATTEPPREFTHSDHASQMAQPLTPDIPSTKPRSHAILRRKDHDTDLEENANLLDHIPGIPSNTRFSGKPISSTT